MGRHTIIGEIKPRSQFGKVTGPVVEEGSASISSTGTTIIEKYQVEEISVSEQGSRFFAMFAPGMPRFGEEHPAIGGIFVQEVRSETLVGDPTKAEVVVTWGLPTGGAGGGFDNDPGDDAVASVEIATTLQSVSTALDVNGVQIIIDKTVLDQDGDPIFDEQPGEVLYQMPMTVVRFRRRELFSPGDKSKLYVGTVNTNPVFGDDPAHTWLCTRIDGISDDGAQTFNVTYEFQRAPQRYDHEFLFETWDATALWIDPETNLAAPDINIQQQDGIKTNIRVYSETDFELLNLTI